ncbi:MAG: DMT family transporter [Balneolaceae bacterium]
MTGWIFILLSAGCSVLIAHFLKLVEFKKLNTVRVLTVNYFIATVVAFLLPGNSAGFNMDISIAYPALILAIIVGVIFIANFFIYSKSVNHNGVGISVAAMRISLIIPVLLSTIWYLDLLTLKQWTGVMIVFAALFLLLPNKRKMLREPLSAAWLLVLLFLGTGLGDGSLKIYEVEFSEMLSKQQFMGIVFLSAMFVGLMVMALRKNWKINRKEIFLGTAIGIPNLYSAIFLIEALERLNGAIVYSSVNILIVLGATFLGLIRWNDKLSKLQWGGIALTMIAILLLRIG